MSRGDAGAFWDLWALHQQHLYAVCARAMDGNHAEAEDALSQVMLKARQQLAVSASQVAAPRAWLTRLARNLCIDIQRDLGRRTKANRQLELLTQAGEALAVNHPESSNLALLTEESEAENRRRVERLPPELREPFVLQFYQELPCDEIAARLGLSMANVRKRLQLARAFLRQNWDCGSGQSKPVSPARTQPEIPSRRQGKWEVTAPAAVARLAPVRLSCGVDRYFQTFLARRPGREPQRIQALRAYLQRHPGSRKRLRELAQLLYQIGAWPEAIRACRQALGQRPFWLSGALLLGEMPFLMGNREDAAAAYTQALPQARQPASERHLRGLLAGCRDNWQEAVTCFEAAASHEPENPVHWHALARAQLQAGRPEAALKALDKALRLNPDDLAALSSGHAALLATGRTEEAWQRVERVLAIAPEDALALTRLAERSFQTSSAKPQVAAQAKRLLRLALRQAPHSPTVLAALAAYYGSRGDRGRVLTLMQELRKRNPGCPRIREDYHRLLASTGAGPPAETAVGTGLFSCTGACGSAGIRAGL
jgi:RNA polymerase sigma factor (sigma-70 family)